MLKVSTLYRANEQAVERIVVNQGGTSSGKTYAIMQLLFITAMRFAGYVITVVGQDIPNLKKGAYRDAKKILSDSEVLKQWFPTINESERVIKCVNGSVIEFYSFKDEQDAKSGKRDVLFINECDGISYEIFWQLNMRTRHKVYLDYNPSSRFWVHEKVIGREGVRLIISDHRHNPFLSQDEHDKIEGIEDYELWKVYARGKTGVLRGLIFQHYNIVDKMPEKSERRGEWYGIDFGFTNDPTAIYNVVLAHGELWLDEVMYQQGQDNPHIAKRLKERGATKWSNIVADSAEPKSIAEINATGLNVVPSDKGADSVNVGISILQRYKINVTRRSVGWLNEAQRYKWKVDRNGNTLNEPCDCFNHAMDAVRYVALKFLKTQRANKGATAKVIKL